MSSQDINNAVKMAAYCALFSNDIYDSKKLVVTPNQHYGHHLGYMEPDV